MIKKIISFLILSFFILIPSYSKMGNPTSSFLDNIEAQKKLQEKLDKKAKKELKKQKSLEKKKARQEKKRLTPRMVETREEWLLESSSLPRIYRDNPHKEPEVNKKLNPIEDPLMYFVKYNDPPGEHEIDLSLIKKMKFVHSDGVASEDFKYLAYVEYSFNPEFNQISSELFVLPLDESLSRLERLRKPNLLLADRDFTYNAGKNELRKDMAVAITIIDWKNDNSALLLKEKTGSLLNGVFRTNVSVVYFDENGTSLAYQTFYDLEQKIKNYWREKKGIHLNFYRWDFKPLGWSSQNTNDIIILAYAYTKDNKKNYLGAWSINYLTGEINLLSLDSTNFDLIVSGIFVKYELDR